MLVQKYINFYKEKSINCCCYKPKIYGTRSIFWFHLVKEKLLMKSISDKYKENDKYMYICIFIYIYMHGLHITVNVPL